VTLSLSFGPDQTSLSRRRKAAIVVQLLLAQGVKPPITKLTEDMQMDLTRELGLLQLVDRGTLHAVIAEFADELEDVGLTAPRGLDAALRALDGHISPSAVARLRAETSGTSDGDCWQTITALSPNELLPILQSEAIEICAVVLSKLPVAKAAEVLGLLPGERARRITYSVSQTHAISPQAVIRIGRAIAAEYGNVHVSAFQKPPVERVGAILNQSQQTTRDNMLAGLGEEDPDFAEKVRRAIFTFVHIPARLRPQDVPGVVRNIDQKVLVTALAAATASGGPEGDAATFILSNMSQRMADSLREEMSELGRVKKTDGETAMASIVTAIRSSEEAKEIKLIRPEDEDGE
jgi:flagellar motor switch protein FliG